MARFSLGNGSGGGEGPYKFVTLSEAEASVGVDDLIWEFTGGAGTNETAVCGSNVGLNGVDLVATQNGGIGAASDGGRPIANESYQYFVATISFWSKFLTNASGFSLLWHTKNHATFSSPTQLFISYLRFDTGIYHEPLAHVQRGLLYAGLNGLSAEASWKSASYSDILPTDGDAWMLISHDPVNNLAFIGVANTVEQPKKLADFGWFNIITGDLDASGTLTSFFNDNRNAMVGGGTTQLSMGQTICSLSARLGPCVFKN